jgi:phycocyanin-associated rod protein
MLGTLISNSSSSSQNRVFVYEVTGLKQTQYNDQNSYPVRNSGSVFIKVPYGRMNEEMQRINRMGGKIVNIHPFVASEGGKKVNSNSDSDSE